MRQRTTAVVVDEWELVAFGIAAVLTEHGILTVATVGDARAGVLAVREHKADLLILGAAGQGSAAEVTRAVLRLEPRPAIIALVSAADHAQLGQLVAAGVDGLLIRSASGDELGEAIRRLRAGERYVTPALLSSLVGALSPVADRGEDSTLTSRERDVLAGLAQGQTNREIADALFVGVETVKSHLSRLYDKLGARDRHDAVAQALAAGLLG